MVCAVCKVRPAASLKFIPQIGKVAPLCSGCSERTTRPTSFTVTTTTTTFNLDPTLSSLFGKEMVQKAVVCTTCGKGFSDYEKTGRLGCSECYRVFEKQLETVLRRIHG